MRALILTLVIALILIIMALRGPLQWMWVITVLISYALIILTGIFSPGLKLFVPFVDRSEGVLLTFDDGPEAERTSEILDLLERKGISAAFFLIGEKAEQRPDLVRRMAKEGHAIGGHSYSHQVRSTFMSTRDYMQEIEKCIQAIRNITGKDPLMYRPPFGVTNPNLAKAITRSGTKPIGWNTRSFDTAFSCAKTLERIKRMVHRNSIVLLHDHGSLTSSALEEFIDHCMQNGLPIASAIEFERSLMT